MSSLHSPAARVVRACIFALVCTLLSAIGHAEVSGHTLSPSALLLAVAGVAAVSWVLAERQVGLCAIGTGLLVGQGVLHLWFSAAPTTGDHGETPATPSAPHEMWAMVGAHFLAAVICAVWLWHGERAFFVLLGVLCVRTLAPLLLLITARPRITGTPELVRSPDPDTFPRRISDVLRHSMDRRGPPRS